jgi:hypothetical protein
VEVINKPEPPQCSVVIRKAGTTSAGGIEFCAAERTNHDGEERTPDDLSGEVSM